MPPRVLHHVKPEIRVLGVAAMQREGFLDLIGVVYRGCSWLDGVMRGRSDSTDLMEAIAKMIECSPHAGQIRVILLDRKLLPGGASVDPAGLRSTTGKPVIALDWPGADLEWRSKGVSRPYGAFGVGKWASHAVLRTSTIEGGIPEALRVASMVVRVIPD